jgi:hypothetical protein
VLTEEVREAQGAGGEEQDKAYSPEPRLQVPTV